MDADVQLVQQVLRGEAGAFGALVERYQNYVFTIAYRVLKSREEAEEVSQDVFIKVYRMLGSFQQKSRFSSWLYAIAYRTAIDAARRKTPLLASIEDDKNYLQVADPESKTPAQALQQEELHQLLQQAISRLRPDDAAIITLFYLNERSVQEIADTMEMTVTNVKTKLHRLREQLRHELARELQAEIQDLR